MTELNREQERASKADGGIHLVLAGAGTGKTKTLVEKVNNIIKEGTVKPEEILILTFSRKAAGEIKERIINSMGGKACTITSGTFHSFSLKLLRDYKNVYLSKRGYSRFPEVITDTEKNEFLNKTMKQYIDDLCGIPIDVALDLLNRKETLPKGIRKKLYHSGVGQCLDRIAKEYSTFKILHNRIDYSDMAMDAISLLYENRSIRDEVQNKYRFVLVDEYQDTSDDNYQLLSLVLPERNGNLFMVGDDWQSIYGFRGAKVEYIIGIKKYFPSVSVHKLVVNYRSKKEIVDLSGRFIKKNKFQSRKKLKSYSGRGGVIKPIQVIDLEEEAVVIERILLECPRESISIGILVRNNWQLEFIEKRIDVDSYNGNIRPMTIHGSKGLEFDTVILGGVSDAIIPDRLSSLEEERRLFYVALTRAKERLYVITHPDGETIPRFAREAGIA